MYFKAVDIDENGRLRLSNINSQKLIWLIETRKNQLIYGIFCLDYREQTAFKHQ